MSQGSACSSETYSYDRIGCSHHGYGACHHRIPALGRAHAKGRSEELDVYELLEDRFPAARNARIHRWSTTIGLSSNSAVLTYPRDQQIPSNSQHDRADKKTDDPI